MAYIQEREDIDGKVRYRVQIRVQGHPTQSKTFERKTDAKLWAQQTENAIREGKYFKTSESKKHTIGDMIDRYIRDVLPSKPKNARNIVIQLNWWKAQIGYCTLSDVTSGLVVEQRDKLARGITIQGKQRSPATVVRYLAALSHVFTTAVNEWGWIEDSPMRKVSKPREARGRVRFLDEEERMRLLDACKASSNPYLYVVVILALSTGMRRGEILSLTWRDVDLDRGRIVLQQTKNGDRRLVPLTGVALELLKQLSGEQEKDDLLFPGQSSSKPMDLRFSWEQAVKVAGIHNFRLHDCRHSCASYLAMSGASLAEIAEVLGHRTLQMVKRYAHLSEAHTQSVVANMNKKYLG